MTTSILKRVVIAHLALLLAPAVRAQISSDLPDFSATEVKSSLSWKIHRSGSKLRVEPSPVTATIYVPEEDKVFNLFIFPEKTTCVVLKTAQAKMMRSPLQVVYGPNTRRTPREAKEVVEGHTCTVLDAVTTLPDHSEAISKIWAADDLKGVPVRIDMTTGRSTMTTTYRDIVLGPPDPALFKLPAKCTPHEKTYQVAPESQQVPGKVPSDQKQK
ncbi:MAG TPA: hypothetical protein VLT90_00140 [Terriglobales bacterium]|nr:hypothetical protein [Terriglobales bacterium]